MANWTDKISKFTQSAVSKSKDLAGIAKLNFDISSKEDEIQGYIREIGKYVEEARLCAEDEKISNWYAQIDACRATISELRQKILELKNVAVCSKCGAEVELGSKFCNSCGAVMTAAAEPVEEEPKMACSKCGTQIPAGSAFCPECGEKTE